MDFWNLMVVKDDYICSIINIFSKLKLYCSFRKQKLLCESQKKYDFGSDDLFIILNGPSINNQDFLKLKGRQLIFVNRGFKHPLYSFLKPRFHVFVDKKMLTGEWPVIWFDQIVEMNPEVIFIMPVSWANKKQFLPYIEKGYNFYWIPFDSPASCLGVAGYCFQFALRQHFKRVFFTGFDGTGLANEILHTTSHFYGTNEENLLKTTKEFRRDFYMFSRHLSDLHRIAVKSQKLHKSIINITDGGLIDMFPRESFDDVLQKKQEDKNV